MRKELVTDLANWALDIVYNDYPEPIATSKDVAKVLRRACDGMTLARVSTNVNALPVLLCSLDKLSDRPKSGVAVTMVSAADGFHGVDLSALKDEICAQLGNLLLQGIQRNKDDQVVLRIGTLPEAIIWATKHPEVSIIPMIPGADEYKVCAETNEFVNCRTKEVMTTLPYGLLYAPGWLISGGVSDAKA